MACLTKIFGMEFFHRTLWQRAGNVETPARPPGRLPPETLSGGNRRKCNIRRPADPDSGDGTATGPFGCCFHGRLWGYCGRRTALAPYRGLARELDLEDGDSTPDGHQTITPYFTVVDADRLIEFLTAAFDARVIRENRYDDTRIQHARLRIGNAIIMLNESSDAYPANTSQMHLYVGDADAAYELALKSGAVSLMEPNDRPHGDRMAGIKDPCGNIWWLATHRS